MKNEFTFASPIIVDLHGTRQVIALAQQSILGISVADGAVLWEHPWKSPYVQAITPVLYRETIIVSGHHRGVMALKPIKREDKWAVEVVWETQEASMFLSNPVVIGDTLFGLSHRNSGQFFALDASTGQVLWLDRPRRATNSALVKADDLLFFLNDDAELIVARSSRTGFEPLKRYTRRRQRHLGPAGDIGKPNLHQRCVVSCVVELTVGVGTPRFEVCRFATRKGRSHGEDAAAGGTLHGVRAPRRHVRESRERSRDPVRPRPSETFLLQTR